MPERLMTPSGFPNFFIIGAPKCGTTALSDYLRQHPNIGFSQPKEPHYFDEDICRDTYSLEEYLKCFAGISGNDTAIGEGSVLYLKSRVAVPQILEYMPNAKFIVMLRNPVDAAYSWHSDCIYNMWEDINDFEEAWRAQEDRAHGRRVPRHAKCNEVLLYGPMFRYGEQLNRLYEKVPRQRVCVILFDDFKRHTAEIYAEVLEFLQVQKIELPKYEVINASKRYRYRSLESMSRSVVRAKSALGLKKGFGVLRWLKEWNTTQQHRAPMSESFRRRLKEYYHDDILRTSSLIGRDLSGWIRD